ncbi:hypothetical protein SLS60_001408 [Paraconiothyrium brasiliense]|uniref:F-box domain-containing protein n=1 Tax=Paraconiothyrium brasiliense TaxID=300254 RepID=A0ABR3S8Z6_9PLEO
MAQMQKLHHANMNASTAENSGGSAVDKKRPIGFLDLPAEVRNRIYYYADERAHRLPPDELHDNGYIPSIMRYAPGNPGPWPIDDCAKSSLKFLGLTEVCRKVRSEYNPIWKATAEFRIRYEDFGLFTQTSSVTKDQKQARAQSYYKSLGTAKTRQTA